jgi:hypothetical protein
MTGLVSLPTISQRRSPPASEAKAFALVPVKKLTTGVTGVSGFAIVS